MAEQKCMQIQICSVCGENLNETPVNTAKISNVDDLHCTSFCPCCKRGVEDPKDPKYLRNRQRWFQRHDHTRDAALKLAKELRGSGIKCRAVTRQNYDSYVGVYVTDRHTGEEIYSEYEKRQTHRTIKHVNRNINAQWVFVRFY